jgi:hypothetical protein
MLFRQSPAPVPQLALLFLVLGVNTKLECIYCQYAVLFYITCIFVFMKQAIG